MYRVKSANIKKNTAAATMAVPTVIIANSLIVLQNFMSFSSFVFEVILHYTSFQKKYIYFLKQKLIKYLAVRYTHEELHRSRVKAPFLPILCRVEHLLGQNC